MRTHCWRDLTARGGQSWNEQVSQHECVQQACSDPELIRVGALSLGAGAPELRRTNNKSRENPALFPGEQQRIVGSPESTRFLTHFVKVTMAHI